jgi:hypothetical protein
MRNALVVIAVVALWPASSAAVEQPRPQKRSETPLSAGRQVPLKGAGAGNPCAAYGPGFVRVDGTQSCVKIGGGISVGAGGSR